MTVHAGAGKRVKSRISSREKLSSLQAVSNAVDVILEKHQIVTVMYERKRSYQKSVKNASELLVEYFSKLEIQPDSIINRVSWNEENSPFNGRKLHGEYYSSKKKVGIKIAMEVSNTESAADSISLEVWGKDVKYEVVSRRASKYDRSRVEIIKVTRKEGKNTSWSNIKGVVPRIRDMVFASVKAHTLRSMKGLLSGWDV